ncbi:MAG TPA: hypothetical protein VLA92_01950 [Candidatus Saccharimonadales bacterium]|nr:hypothetical protein [Candidatus Saccharimonadales bacterium]
MLPNPNTEAVALWLSQLDRKQLHDTGWKEVNRELHGVARAVRPFINEQFETDAQKEAAFDGLVLGLTTLLRFEDIEALSRLVAQPQPTKEPSKDQIKPA